MRRIAAHLLFTPSGLLPNMVVTIDNEGVITDISEVSGSVHLDGEAGVEFFGGILVPGFVNSHCHLELSHLQGIIPAGGGLTAFAQGMRTAREKGLRAVFSGAAGGTDDAENRSREVVADGTKKAVEEGAKPSAQQAAQDTAQDAAQRAISFWDSKMWTEGIAAVGDICNGDSTFDIKRASPVLYHNFCELFGLNADPKRAFELRDKALATGLTASVTPHSTYSLNRAAFAAALAGGGPAESGKAVGNTAASPQQTARKHAGNEAYTATRPTTGGWGANPPENTGAKSPLSIHFLESEEENDLFRRRGAMWQWYDNQGFKPDFLDYNSPTERLISQVPAEREVMLIHNCAVTQRDIDLIMSHFTAPVTWVLCPRSNRHISKTAPPFRLLTKNGLRIAIGTDSAASNEGLSMVREMAEFHDVPLEEVLRWATINGARALGMGDRLGSIEVGKSPGLVLLTGVNLQSVSLTENSRAIRII